MDLNEIKEIIESEGGKIIIIENGQPVMIILSFADYKKKKENTVKNPPRPLPKELAEGELQIEDLPF